MSALKLDNITAKENWDSNLGFMKEDWSVSYASVLKALNKIYSFTHLIDDDEYQAQTTEFIYRARKELLEKMDKECSTVCLGNSGVVPKDAIFILTDCSNMWANYNYFYSPSDNKIYEERCPLGD